MPLPKFPPTEGVPSDSGQKRRTNLSHRGYTWVNGTSTPMRWKRCSGGGTSKRFPAPAGNPFSSPPSFRVQERRTILTTGQELTAQEKKPKEETRENLGEIEREPEYYCGENKRC